MSIFSVCIRKKINTWIYIPTYHHWNYVVCDSQLYCIFKSWVLVNQTCDMVILPLCLLCANDGVTTILFPSGSVSTTPVQIYCICATSMQTSGVSATILQSGAVSTLTRTIFVIAFSLWQSTFSSLVMKKVSNLPALRSSLNTIQVILCPNQMTLRPIQTIPYVIPVWV